MNTARRILAAGLERFSRFSPREQVMVIGAAALLLGAVGYSGIWQPTTEARRADLAAINDIDIAMMQVRAAPETLRQPTASRTQPLAAVIAETAPRFALAVQRIDPEADGARVTLDEADFAALLLWIAALETDHAVLVTAARIERRPAPGLVSAEITLER